MIRNVFSLKTQNHNFDLSTLRSIIQKGINVNLSTQAKGSLEPVIVFSKLANMDVDNEQKLAQSAQKILSHFSETFGMVLNWRELELSHLFLPANSIVLPCTDTQEALYIVIATTTVDKWKQICVDGAQKTNQLEHRWICNQIWDHLIRVYTDVFTDRIKLSNKDGTFTLSWSHHQKR